MSALYNRVQDVYVLWTRYGTLGETGMFQKTPFQTRDACTREFEKVFKQKSGNTWASRREFQPIRGKYALLTGLAALTASDEQLQMLSKVNPMSLPAAPVPDAAPAPVGVLFRLLTDTAPLVSSLHVGGYRDRCFQLPFGVASTKALGEAKATLERIAVQVTQLEQLQQISTTAEMQKSIAEQEAVRKELKELSDTFYTLIPAARRWGSAVRIDSREFLASASEELNELTQQNTAAKIILGAYAHRREVLPWDYMLRATQTKIVPVAASDPAFEMLKTYAGFSLGEANFRVAAVFRLERVGEADAFAPYMARPQRTLLWHGTRSCNVLGILRNGLQVAPLEAQHAGQAFGKGVYFADAAVKSLNYAQESSGNPNTKAHRVLFAAEVFVGKAGNLSNPGDEQCDSRFVLGQQGPREMRIETATGCRLPWGPMVARGECRGGRGGGRRACHKAGAGGGRRRPQRGQTTVLLTHPHPFSDDRFIDLPASFLRRPFY
jgi:hypothetical protein